MRIAYDIKPCPFCGGAPKLERSSRAFINGESTKVAYIWCTNCNARSPRVPLIKYGKTSASVDAEAEVVTAWNRRV